MTMMDFVGKIKHISEVIHNVIETLPDSDCQYVITEMDYQTNENRVIEGIELDNALNIFGIINYKSEQDSKEAYRRPGVIQCKRHLRDQLLPLIFEYNKLKKDVEAYHRDLLKTYPDYIVKDLWQSASAMLNLKQLFRVIHFFDGDISYCGLSIVTKPVVNKISKEQALEKLSLKKEVIPFGVDPVQYLSMIEDKEKEIQSLSEGTYEFRIARRGAPRPVANIKPLDISLKPQQKMASMPVFIFTNKFVDVSMPKPKMGRSRLRRSDAFIELDPVAGAQLKIIPTQNRPSS